tara:strand:+ start:15146 stop:15919 length:774 start_codon:yes stop_codon:yes gene_type:complete
MMPLFSKSSMIVLESLSFTKTLYAFDFDGTLAKIVSAPSDAYMTKTTESLLRELSKLVPVAIVSGRALDDLKKRVGFKPQFLIGNHNLEISGEEKKSIRAAMDTCQRWLEVLHSYDFGPGVEIEEKIHSLAIHYRRSRGKKEAVSKIKEAIGHLSPNARVIFGKSVVNLIPLGAPHKGTAILDLIKRSMVKHIFYIGDDESDEDIFSLDYTAGQIMTVRVGQKRSSQAKYYIKHQSEINHVLKTIIRFHRPILEASR